MCPLEDETEGAFATFDDIAQIAAILRNLGMNKSSDAVRRATHELQGSRTLRSIAAWMSDCDAISEEATNRMTSPNKTNKARSHLRRHAQKLSAPPFYRNRNETRRTVQTKNVDSPSKLGGPSLSKQRDPSHPQLEVGKRRTFEEVREEARERRLRVEAGDVTALTLAERFQIMHGRPNPLSTLKLPPFSALVKPKRSFASVSTETRASLQPTTPPAAAVDPGQAPGVDFDAVVESMSRAADSCGAFVHMTTLYEMACSVVHLIELDRSRVADANAANALKERANLEEELKEEREFVGEVLTLAQADRVKAKKVLAEAIELERLKAKRGTDDAVLAEARAAAAEAEIVAASKRARVEELIGDKSGY